MTSLDFWCNVRPNVQNILLTVHQEFERFYLFPGFVCLFVFSQPSRCSSDPPVLVATSDDGDEPDHIRSEAEGFTSASFSAEFGKTTVKETLKPREASATLGSSLQTWQHKRFLTQTWREHHESLRCSLSGTCGGRMNSGRKIRTGPKHRSSDLDAGPPLTFLHVKNWVSWPSGNLTNEF